jgi:uncharacterized zinc-type alcohol dehydrogenase-like protein
MPKIAAYAMQSATAPLAPFSIARRDPGPHDVQIEILYCGICHTDIHKVRNEWGGTTYPCVPGHEIVGRVTKIGNQVKKFKEGEIAGIGCMVDSCRTCPNCKEGLEQYCDNGSTFTYDAPDKVSGGVTYGGYSTQIVADENYVLKIRHKENLAAVAPLLCAGITTYSPLRRWNVRKGQKVGVVGLGGLGHMGVKLAHAMGAHVVMFTTSPGKTQDAQKLGADEVVVSKNVEEMKKHSGSFDFILNTVAAPHDLNVYLELLKRDGAMCLVGVPSKPHLPLAAGSLIMRRRTLAGSLIGGIRETQEMLDFCAERGIVSEIETIPISQVNEAYERILKSDVKYRFVIDMASLKG